MTSTRIARSRGHAPIAQTGDGDRQDLATAPTAEMRADVPVSAFALAMSLSALSLAWRTAAALGVDPDIPASVFGVAACLGFTILTGFYATKWAHRPAAVRAEFDDPITRNFFGMPLISLLLLAIVIAPVSRTFALAIWAFGGVGMVIFAWMVVTRWLRQPQQPMTVSTAWLIVAVGILDIPLAMPALSIPMRTDLGLICLAVGLALAAMLYVVIVLRFMFGPPPPAAQMPTVLIAAAPLAVGCSAYMAVLARADAFALILLGLAVVTLAGLLLPVGTSIRRSKFSLSWWGTGFPVAATAVAALRYAADTQAPHAALLASALLIAATAQISGLLALTITSVMTDQRTRAVR